MWYGMRHAESSERAKRYEGKISNELYTPHEFMPSSYPKYLGSNGVKFRLPIVEWSTGQVFDFLEGRANPLYQSGFERVGCFPCMAGGDKSKLKAFMFDDTGLKHYREISDISVVIESPVFRTKGHSHLNHPMFNKQRDLLVNDDSHSGGCSVCEI